VVIQPPTNGGTLTANAAPEALDPLTDPLSLASLQQHHLLVSPPGQPAAAAPAPSPEPAAMPAPAPEPAAPATVGFNPPGPDQTIVDLENSVQSPHAAAAVADARDQVAQALADNTAPAAIAPPAPSNDPLTNPPANTGMQFDPSAMGITTDAAPPAGSPAPTTPAPSAATPPPVPPPIPFQFGAPPSTPGV
jgi:hypothetical protein